MRYIPFGKTGLKVSEFALGTGTLGGGKDGSIDVAEAEAMLRLYLDAGGDLIDTAEAYQGGRSEEILGNFLGGQREDVVLISKCTRSTRQNASPTRKGNHRKAMHQAVEGSLRRLRTDRIDIYFAHYDDQITPMEELMRGFDDLVSAGKILYPGLSNFPAWRMMKGAAAADYRGWTPLAAIEVRYSLLDRAVEQEILPFAKDCAIAVLAYSPLAKGLLAKRDARQSTVENDSELSTKELGNDKIWHELNAIAEESGTAPAHVSLAWLVKRTVFPILGGRTSIQLAENLPAAQVELTSDQDARLSSASAIPFGYPHDVLATTSAFSPTEFAYLAGMK
jgi:aryl-alcohol dehydrogenase-like predicted oxidoreductase